MNYEHLQMFMSNLPRDVQNFISYEYVKPDMILTELNTILESHDSRNLDCNALYHYLKNVVLLNNNVVNYLIKNNNIFKIIYDKHITKGEKTFIEMKDPILSMSLSWLMYLYH